MPAWLALFAFLVSLGGIGVAGFGARMLIANRRLETRLARVVPVAAREWDWLHIPGFLAARGRDGLEVEQKLRLAGFQGARAVEHFLWIRIGVTIAAALLVSLASKLWWGGFLARPLLVIIVGGLVYIMAKQALGLVAAHRSRSITAEFPFLLDLMLMMLESGVSLDQCFRSIAREEGGAAPQLTRSLGILVADLDRGMNYDAALDRWAERVAVGGAKELAALFRQAMFQGAELSRALRDFVREFTERRVATAREAIGRVTVQMIVVMILFFMPALFIVLGGPPLASLLDTLHGARQ